MTMMVLANAVEDRSCMRAERILTGKCDYQVDFKVRVTQCGVEGGCEWLQLFIERVELPIFKQSQSIN
ncbi:hypothetical protein M271_23585 [Streptomyces rapamycinicus NRRL 5491]|nr:hypothetical protein M271_23585 [Streptomyces rapamycinicus NRRL 5491]